MTSRRSRLRRYTPEKLAVADASETCAQRSVAFRDMPWQDQDNQKPSAQRKPTHASAHTRVSD